MQPSSPLATLDHASGVDSSGNESDVSSTLLTPPILESDRPNTHHGLPSTWRSRTLSERRLAASLDQLSAKDLAVHLYNAYVLSNTTRNLNNRKEANDHIDQQAWSPPTLWTAWPLAPAHVPAEDEGVRWESEAYMNGPTQSKKLGARETLEDILLGHVQNKAKQRLSERLKHDGSLELPEAHLDGDEEPALLKPVVMADDDMARSIAEPSVRHIMAKLDGLLTALHHARHAYAVVDESGSDFDGIDANKKVRQKRKSSRKCKQNRSRRGKSKPRVSNYPLPSQTETETETVFDADGQPKHSSAHDSKRPDSKYEGSSRSRIRKRQYGLRDWSDIIGIASMTGWEPSIVRRAAARCANLFEEGQKSTTLNENGTASNQVYVLPESLQILLGQTEGNINDVSSTKHDANNEPARVPKPQRANRDRQGWRFYCPVADCNRSSYGFWEACRLTRHLKQVHKEINLQAISYEPEREDEIFEGVHVDGYLQPIPPPGAWASKSGSGRGVKRPRPRKG